jgi:hypothetical protein
MGAQEAGSVNATAARGSKGGGGEAARASVGAPDAHCWLIEEGREVAIVRRGRE